MSSFENLRIVDNFYQTSLFFPMPTVIISTLCEDGTTNLGPYSLVQPYYVAGKDYYAMLLSCRNSSNTAQNLLRNRKCTLNFIDDKPKTFKETVKLSWPGDKPEDKMPKCSFRLERSLTEEETGEIRPQVMTDAIEAIECTRMRAELLQIRKASLESVRYAADRVDNRVRFTDEALMTILSVPRVFLSLVLKSCVDWAKENNVDTITVEHMQIINDKRSKEKNRK